MMILLSLFVGAIALAITGRRLLQNRLDHRDHRNHKLSLLSTLSLGAKSGLSLVQVGEHTALIAWGSSAPQLLFQLDREVVRGVAQQTCPDAGHHFSSERPFKGHPLGDQADLKTLVAADDRDSLETLRRTATKGSGARLSEAR